MTRAVVTVGPDTSAKYAAELMAEHGFAAIPVVDDDDRLVGIVAEVDVLRNRVSTDPRLHLRRSTGDAELAPALVVRGVMTTSVRQIDTSADLADIARLFVDQHLRSVPVIEGNHLAGIVSRRDLLRALVRADRDIREDLVRLIEGYTGELDSWQVTVVEGVAAVRRIRGVPEVSVATEHQALRSLAHTVAGVVSVSIDDGGSQPVARTPRAPAAR